MTRSKSDKFYCGEAISLGSMCEDHLVPMNKEALGLHAWGNIVPACKTCNASKHYKNWAKFISFVCSTDTDAVERRSSSRIPL